jgi:hypothetical protein
MLEGSTCKKIRLLQIEDPVMLTDSKSKAFIRAQAEHVADYFIPISEYWETFEHV